MRILVHILAIVVWLSVIGAELSVSDSVLGVVFFLPFTLGPHAVSHGLCFRLKSTRALVVLGIGMLGYWLWFFYVFRDAFYVHVDPQSAIALLFVGVISLPVMIPVWAVAYGLERRAKSADQDVVQSA